MNTGLTSQPNPTSYPRRALPQLKRLKRSWRNRANQRRRIQRKRGRNA